MKYFSKIIFSILVISILFLFSGCKGDPTVGKFNGDELLTSEFKYFLENTKAKMLIEAGISAEDSNNQGQINEYWKDSKNQTKARTNTFDELVKFKILYNKAKENNFKLLKEDEDNFNSNFKRQYEERNDFKNQLDENLGISIDKFKELTYNMFYTSKYEEQEAKKIEVTDSETEDYFNKNKDKFDIITTVRHILFMTEEKTDKEKEEAKKKAQDILKLVREGGDMIELAEKNSEDPTVVENKGEYEVIKESGLIKAFEDWALKANVGDSEIVETDFGYHVMKCEKKSPFKEFENEAKEALQKEKYLEELEEEVKDNKNKIEKEQKAIDEVKIK